MCGAEKTYNTEFILGSYSNKERLDHAVGFPALRLATIIVDGCLNDSHNVVTKLQLREKNTNTHRHTRGIVGDDEYWWKDH